MVWSLVVEYDLYTFGRMFNWYKFLRYGVNSMNQQVMYNCAAVIRVDIYANLLA